MKTKAAVLWGLGQKWEVEEIDLDPPGAGEVMVQLTATGLCHSDEHLVTGDLPIPLPVVGGHEGAGRIAEVGPGVTGLAVGDPVVMSFLPSCGQCAQCAGGHSNLCDFGAALMQGPQLDGSYRFHGRGQDIGQMCLLGTFSQHTVVPTASVVKVDEGTALEKAALVGCGVTTGFGSSVRTAEVQPGETVVVVGAGGIGVNAIQGARVAGARHIVAIDPNEWKRTQAVVFGATHTATSMTDAVETITELTRGNLANACILTTGVAEGDHVGEALALLGRRGRLVITAIGHPTETSMTGSLLDITLYEKQIRGSLFGSSNPRRDIPGMLDLYNSGQVKLDELVTREYTLDEINQGYDDLREGRNIRGLIRF